MRLIEGWPALLLEKPRRTLIVSDVHFGFEAELAERGVRVPSQSQRLRELFLEVIGSTEAERMIILGDLKHQVPLSSWIEWREMPRVIEDIRGLGLDIYLVPGNHDGGIESMLGDRVNYLPSRGVLIEAEQKIYLLHGHTWPSPSVLEADLIVMGHLHPMVGIRTDVGAVVKRRAWLLMSGDRRTLAEVFVAKARRRKPINLIIIPAFNPILTGITVNSLTPRDKLWPLMRSKAFNLSEAEVVMLDGVRLGKISELTLSD